MGGFWYTPGLRFMRYDYQTGTWEVDKTKYSSYDDYGVREFFIQKSPVTQEVSIAGIPIPVSEFQVCRVENSTPTELVRVVLLDPEADQESSVIRFWKSWPVSNSDGIVVMERGPWRLEITAEGEGYVMTIHKINLKIWPGGSDLDNGEENRPCPGDDDNAFLSEEEEDEEGAYILVNWDDDDEDGNLTAGEAGWIDPIPDLAEKGDITNEDNLARIKLDFPLYEIREGTIKFEVNKPDKIKLWGRRTKGTPIFFPPEGRTWNLSDTESTDYWWLEYFCGIKGKGFWIEGLEESTEKEVEFKVTYTRGDLTCSDTVKVTVVMMNLGNAVYREAFKAGSPLKERCHAAIPYRFVGELKKQNIMDPKKYYICALPEVSGIKYLDNVTEHEGLDYWYCYTNPFVGYSSRLKILRVVWWIMNRWEGQHYVWSDQIRPMNSTWDGTLSDIKGMRCDGIVELAYEYNNIMVWGKIVEGDPNPHYSIRNPAYLEEHNDWQWGDDPGDFEDGMWTTCLPVTQGGFADQYIIDNNWKNFKDPHFKGTYWESMFGLDNEQRLVFPEQLSPEKHQH